MTRNLHATNNKGTKYEINVDASEVYLAEAFVLRHCGQLMRTSQCSTVGCADRQMSLKFLTIIGGSIKQTVTNAAQRTTSRKEGCLKQLAAPQEQELCRGTRTDTPIRHMTRDAPLVIVFAAVEPLLCDKVTRLDYPADVCLFGKTYHLKAVSFLERPRTIGGCGHYKCALKSSNGWLLYDGLKKLSKPPCLRAVKGPKDFRLKELDPCIITYALETD